MPTPPPPRPPVTRLPGLGERLDLRDHAGAPVAVVRRLDGSVEVHHHGPGPLLLAPAAARAAGAFVSGHYAAAPELLDRVGEVIGGLVLDAVLVQRGSVADGRTITELQVRRRTGVTIVAVLRGAQPIVDPDPDVRLGAGDELVVMASEMALDRFRPMVGTVG